MTLYQLRFESIYISAIYAQEKQDIERVLEEFNKPEFTLPRPLHFEFNRIDKIEPIEQAKIVFDYGGSFQITEEPFSWSLDDFMVQVRKESLGRFASSQQYFLKYPVGNLYMIRHADMHNVILPHDIAQKMMEIDTTPCLHEADTHLDYLTAQTSQPFGQPSTYIPKGDKT